MAVCVRGVFTLAPDQELEAIEDPIEQGFMSGDTFADDDINHEGPLVTSNDFADFKLNAEVLVNGTCHPPGGPTTESHVRVQVGDWSKTLRCVGPRVFKAGLLRGSISEAQPFASMPLTWSNAYGGEGYGTNPVGRGFSGEELPTVEHPDTPVKKVGQRDVAPATFLPVSPNWPQRLGKRGKNYGTSWKKHRAPFYADDFDWTCLHAAADDQQLAGYLRGDEHITFENLHPTHPKFDKQLPGLRLRAFVKTTDGRIHEPTMNLDTLFADVDGEKLYLTWRGLTPIDEVDMSDVGVVLIASESLIEDPRPAQHYIDQLAAFEADPVGLQAKMPAGFLMFAEAMEAVEQAELHDTPMPDLEAVANSLPPDCPLPPWFLAAAAGDEDPLSVRQMFPPGMLDGDPAMGRGSQLGGLADPAVQAKIQDDVAGLAEDPGQIVDIAKMLVKLLPPDKQGPLDEGIRSMEAALAQNEADLGENVFAVAASKGAASPPAKPAGQSYAEMMQSAASEVTGGAEIADTADNAAKAAEAQSQLASAPQDLDAAVAPAMASLDGVEIPPPPPIPDADAQLAAEAEKLEAQEQRMRDKFGDHPMLGMFDLGRNILENAPRVADVMPDLSPIPVAMAKAQADLAAQGVSTAAMAPLAALTAKVQGLVDALPKPAPLPEGDFAAANLRGRDFSGRDMKGQCFARSDLTGAKFVGTDLTGADFTRADLSLADLTGATVSDATFQRAVLSKAVLRDVVGHRARFGNADLSEVDATGAQLADAKANNSRAPKAVFANALLSAADLRFADWSKADLRGADLRGADLSFATCNLVKADRVDLRDAKLDIAKINKARLQDADLRGAQCNLGQLTGSDLTGADLRGCKFEKVDLMKAVLDRADCSDAQLHGVQLRDVQANGTNFRGSDLSNVSATGAARFVDCDFRHGTAERSVWMQADLSRSSFRHARLNHAFFDGAIADDADFTAATLKHANFRKVTFTRVSFACADLAGSIFQGAHVDDGDFQRSNCYDAKFLGAKAVRCRFEHAFLAGVQLDDPDDTQPGAPK